MSALRSFLGGRYAEWLTRPGVGCTIAALAVAAFGASIYSGLHADVGMPDNYFFTDDADLAKWNDANDRLFGGGLAPAAVITDTDYSAAAHVTATASLVARLTARADVVVVDCWLLAYQGWQAQVTQQATAAGLTVTETMTSLPAFLDVAPAYKQDLTDLTGATSQYRPRPRRSRRCRGRGW